MPPAFLCTATFSIFWNAGIFPFSCGQDARSSSHEKQKVDIQSICLGQGDMLFAPRHFSQLVDLQQIAKTLALETVKELFYVHDPKSAKRKSRKNTKV